MKTGVYSSVLSPAWAMVATPGHPVTLAYDVFYASSFDYAVVSDRLSAEYPVTSTVYPVPTWSLLGDG